MQWCEINGQDKCPSLGEIEQFIGNPLFSELCGYIEQTYGVKPTVEYSQCSGARGWNIKYKKSAKSLCVIYPNQGYFTCLVVIGNKEQPEAEHLLPSLDKYIQELYERTRFACGGRWLMIDIKSQKILESTKVLISLRAKKKTASKINPT